MGGLCYVNASNVLCVCVCMYGGLFLWGGGKVGERKALSPKGRAHGVQYLWRCSHLDPLLLQRVGQVAQPVWEILLDGETRVSFVCERRKMHQAMLVQSEKCLRLQQVQRCRA